MDITVGNEIWINAWSLNPENRINTDAGICIYNGRVYLYNRTNRYWHNSARGNVVELRNIDGKKLGEAGTKEITIYDPQYWDYMEADGLKVPEKVKEFYRKLKERWSKRR